MLDIPVPEHQFGKIKEKYITAKNVKSKYKNPTQKIQSQYKKAKWRFKISQQVISNSPWPRTRSYSYKQGEFSSNPNKKTNSSQKQYQKRLDKANAKISELEKKLSDANLKNAQLEKQLKF